LISEPIGSTPSVVLKVLKQRVSRDLRKKSGQARGEGLLRFWQPRFYDFKVYSAKKRREKLEYMHANPVTRELVQHPNDWPWSSFSYYAKGESGFLPIDPVV
jgi:putative transposase